MILIARLVLTAITMIVPLLAVTPEVRSPLAVCTDAEIAAANAALPAYTPVGTGDFVRTQGRVFVVNGQPLAIRGINYYPQHYPWRRFLTETNLAEVAVELDLLQRHGINALRLFLWHDALFQCPGSGAVPQPEAFARLDGVMALATARGMYVNLTLHDLPDLSDYPLYDDPVHTRAQRAFLVERYRDEPAIFAWDVRNEGDIDYGSNNAANIRFPREQVLAWAEAATAHVRSLDANHLVTAGWFTDQEATISFVDFVSFHHWGDAASLIGRIEATYAATDKPMLLQEFGYSTQRMSEDDQARTIGEIIHFAGQYELAGWMIWTAFDFSIDRTCYPSPCVSPDNAEHYFGLWRLGYETKPAVSIIELP
ncbi:MAG: cellulase family glycosylhydrolase [Chloroflexota bacterium]|nr:cellulase family glycosylhydrolase [Chloroflexota bacterium]